MSFEVGSRFMAGGPSTGRSEAGSPSKETTDCNIKC